METLKSRSKVLGLAAAVLMVVPLLAYAETVVRTGDSVSIGVNQIVENDFYAAGGSVTHSGEVKEDIYVVAGSVTMNGAVGEDLTAIGGTIQVNSAVNDDVRVIGGEVVISGSVKGDVFVVGGLLRVLSSANIAGNVYFYGGDAEIEGVVKGVVMGSAESFLLNGEVGGTDLSAVTVALGESANVRGDLSYSSVREVERAAGAVVEGETIRGASPDQERERGSGSLIFMFSWVFTSLCFFLLLRSPLEKLLYDIKRDPARTGLIGLAVVIGLPIVSVVLLVTVIGAWVGLVTLLAAVLLFLTAVIFMPILLGGYISGFLFKGRRLDFFAVAIGIISIAVATYIPVIGCILLAAVFVVVVGVLCQMVYRWGRNLV